MKFVILNLERLKIVTMYLVRSIPNLHDSLQICSIFIFILQNKHKLFKIFFFLLQIEEFLQFFKCGENIFLNFLTECLMNQE